MPASKQPNYGISPAKVGLIPGLMELCLAVIPLIRKVVGWCWESPFSISSCGPFGKCELQSQAEEFLLKGCEEWHHLSSALGRLTWQGGIKAVGTRINIKYISYRSNALIFFRVSSLLKSSCGAAKGVKLVSRNEPGEYSVRSFWVQLRRQVREKLGDQGGQEHRELQRQVWLVWAQGSGPHWL